jgi:hypothetical protein
MLVCYFDVHKECLKEEGLFRRSVSVDDEKETIQQLQAKDYNCLMEIKNPHIVASKFLLNLGLIKKFFHSLKEPAIPFDLYNKLMKDESVTDKSAHLKSVVAALPELNKISLTFVFNFFKEKVIKNEADNKMSANNIAVCFAPCILRSKVSSFDDIANSKKAVEYCKIALNDLESIFGTEKQQEAMYRKSYLESKKTFEQSLGVEIEGDKLPIVQELHIE